MNVMGVDKNFQIGLTAYFTEEISNDAINLVKNPWLQVIWPITHILPKGHNIKLPFKYLFY